MELEKRINVYGTAAVFVIILLFISSSTTIFASSNIATPEEAVHIVVENVLTCDKDEVLLYVWGPVLKGVDVGGVKEFIMKTPEDGYVVYIDLFPKANMFHPVQYVFISESTGEYIVKDSTGPPVNMDEYQMIQTKIGDLINSVENRRAPIPNKKVNLKTSTSQTKWAVLMNGGYGQGSNHVRYWNDLSNIYIALNYVNGYADENIIVLCSDGLDPAVDQSNGQNSDPDLDGDGDEDIMYSCILSNVELVFSELANILNEGDKLFVFTTDHGSSNGGWDVVQNLWNGEELTDAHFASLLAALPDCEIICTFEPCFSGGFLDDVVVPPGPVVASSACRHDESSWAMSNLEYDEYVFHWTAAVKGEDAYGNAVDADYNQDGIITMDEAYLYAVNNDVQPEDPQYGDYPEGFGASISLSISNVAPNDPDQPDGPGDGLINNEYTYNTSTTDPEGDEIYYKWDWDDGAYSDWLGPYAPGEESSASKMWDEIGQYYVQVKAKDGPGAESNWSYPLVVNIVDTPVLEIGEITGGLKINAVIKNNGADAIGVDTTITVDGGLVLFGKEKIGKIPFIETDSEITISSDLLFGFGNVQITIDATIDEVSASKTVDGFVFLFFVVIS